MSIRCSCGETNKDGARFCNRCGSPLSDRDVSEICPGCGYSNIGFVQNCEKCGRLLRRDFAKQTIPGEEEIPEDQIYWSKSLGLPGFYESSIRDGTQGPQVETKFSVLGFSETSTYPRWMITWMIWGFLGLLLLLGVIIVDAAIKADRMDLVALGIAVIGISLLSGYATYRWYYRPPSR